MNNIPPSIPFLRRIILISFPLHSPSACRSSKKNCRAQGHSNHHLFHHESWASQFPVLRYPLQNWTRRSPEQKKMRMKTVPRKIRTSTANWRWQTFPWHLMTCTWSWSTRGNNRPMKMWKALRSRWYTRSRCQSFAIRHGRSSRASVHCRI